MSLISLLIALASQRYLSSSVWQFNTFYRYYLNGIKRFDVLPSPWQSSATAIAYIGAPALLVYLLLDLINDSLLHLVISSLVLIICFGCVKTRETYKNYLLSAFRGEATTCELHHEQLQQDKNLPEMGFGQILVWLNYRYFIAIMLFFVVFGAAGALFYRLLSTVAEGKSVENAEITSDVITLTQRVLFWLDWIPVRLVAFGYMLVGHFSKALPVWLENIFEINKPSNKVLIEVAEKSEDFMVDEDFNPWLIEINASPSLSTTTKRDKILKTDVIKSIFDIVIPEDWGDE